MADARRLSHALGAAITGIDLTRPLSAADRAFVIRAWLDNQVVVFPGQHLSAPQLAEFGRTFGELDTHLAAKDYMHPDSPAVYLITNHKMNGQPSQTRDTGRLWHSDHSFTTKPDKATLLHCLEMPPVGGNTLFANMHMAYEGLSDTLKQVLESLEAVHSFGYYVQINPHVQKRNREQTQKHIDATPPVAHPIVRIHEETGRKALYVSEGYTSHIAGMTREESRGLLEYLFRHCTQPEYTYRHAWTPGDLLMWDNRSVLHLAPADYTHEHTRHMHRVTVLGSPCGRLWEEAA